MHVLFLCTGNSCRSQMAEGWARAIASKLPAKDLFEFSSAGLEAHGLNPRAVAVMADKGVDISSQTSDVLTDSMLASTDLVVSVCAHADEHCPLLPAHIPKRHIAFDDPAKAVGDESEVMACFQLVCEEIRIAMNTLVHELAADKL